MSDIRKDHHLPDVMAAGQIVVFCGTAAGKVSSQRKAYYAGPGNKFFPMLHEAGFTDRRLTPSEFRELASYRLGLTDLNKSESGNDNEISAHGFDISRLKGLLREHQPQILAFNGKKAAAEALDKKSTKSVAYGWQATKLESTRLFVLPSTSGSASGYWQPEFWFELGRTYNSLIKAR